MRKVGLSLARFLVVSACFAQAGGGGLAVASPHGGAVAFASSFGVYVENADGTALRRVMESTYSFNDFDPPVWSPDAKRIVVNQIYPAAVYVVSRDGSVREVGSGHDPAWSPDGSKLAFNGSAEVLGEPESGLAIANADGTGVRVIPSRRVDTFSWSPDGTRIAYTVDREKPAQIHIVDVARGSIGTLGPSFGSVSCPVWSPDGAKIAFNSDLGLELIDAAGGEVTKLAPAGRCPVWSPDGTTIASGRAGPGLRVVAAATGKVTTLTSRGANLDPVWAPDGTKIAFVRGSALLVIGSDGRGERQLATGVDQGWTQPYSWTGDGSVLFFERQRSSEGHDIWRVRADGSGAMPLTHAFPTGADFTGPRWAATTILPPPAELPTRWLTLQPARILKTRGVVKKLSADAGRAAIEAPGEDSCGPIGIWDPRTRLDWVPGSSCATGEGLPEDHNEMVLAGKYAAWTTTFTGMPDLDALEVGTARSGATRVDEEGSNGAGVRDEIGNLAGDGSLLVYNTWEADYGPEGISPPVISKLKVWRVLRGGTRELLASGPSARNVVSVDARRIAVLRPNGTVAILNEQGRRLSAFHLGGKGVDGVKLTGARLVVLRGQTIEVRDAAPGTLRHRWRAAASDAPIALEDAQGGFAVYTAGIAIHLLRLSDGRDRVLSVSNEEGPAHADLESEGLYYSFSEAGSSTPGRVAFVPRRELTARFR